MRVTQNDDTAIAIDCDSECEIETLISLTPAFLAASAASPYNWIMLAGSSNGRKLRETGDLR